MWDKYEKIYLRLFQSLPMYFNTLKLYYLFESYLNTTTRKLVIRSFLLDSFTVIVSNKISKKS